METDTQMIQKMILLDMIYNSYDQYVQEFHQQYKIYLKVETIEMKNTIIEIYKN